MSGSIEVLGSDQLVPGAHSPGIIREKAFETDAALFSKSTIAGGNVSAWHHHGERELFGYMLSGRLRLEYGEDGLLSVELKPGDFFHVPIGLIHRDVNPILGTEAVVVNLLAGNGPTVVNVDRPV